jgi:hypothetical protein
VGTHKTMSKNYRKVFERYHQCTLLDGVDIHHIDGDHNNNHPDNLRAVTLQEHYDIHKAQNDHYACVMIALRMYIKPEDWKEMARINGAKSGTPELRSLWGKKGGAIAYEGKLGIHGASIEQKQEWASQGGKKASELGLGFKAGHPATAGKIGGKKGGAYAKENRTGIFALTPEQIKAKNQKAAITKLINNGKASAWPKKEGI